MVILVILYNTKGCCSITVWLLRTCWPWCTCLCTSTTSSGRRIFVVLTPTASPSSVAAMCKVFPLTFLSMCVLKRGLPTRECWLTSSTACWVKRPELQEAQEVEQLEPASRVLPRKQVRLPFPLLPLRSFCPEDLFPPSQIQFSIFFFKFAQKLNCIALWYSVPCHNMVCVILDSKDSRIGGPMCCCYSLVSVQPEFLKREKKQKLCSVDWTVDTWRHLNQACMQHSTSETNSTHSMLNATAPLLC